MEQELDKRKLTAQSGQEAYRVQHKKNLAMKAGIKQKKATLLIILVAGSMVTFLNQQPSNTDHGKMVKNEEDKTAILQLIDEEV